MHQQEVAGIGLLTHLLRDAGSHRHGGDTGRADKGIDLFLQEQVHELSQQHAACRTEAEGHDTHGEDGQGLAAEEGSAGSGSTNRHAQEDGDDVHQLVLCRLAETIGNTALLEEVTQHQAGNEGRGGGNQQGHEDGDHHGEDDLLLLADLAQRLHDDLTLLLRGQQLHDGRLDHGDKSHVGVSRHGDGAQQGRCQHGGDEDRRRTVSTADDTHGGGLRAGKSQQTAAHIGHKDTDLRRSTQQQALGVGDQRAKVGHGAHAHEDEAGIDAQLNAQIEDINKTGGESLSHRHRGEHVSTDTQLRHLGEELSGDRCAAKEIPVDMSAGEEDLVVHSCTGQVGHQHTDGDRHQQQGLKLLDDAEEQQHAGDEDHHRAFPVISYEKLEKSRLFAEIDNCLHCLPSITGWCTAARRSPR